MKLTMIERLILRNQFLLLERMCPEDASYAQHRKALERGYEGQYEAMIEGFVEPGLGDAECRIVWDVLVMYDTLERGYRRMIDKRGIEEDRTRFEGFEGADEGAYMRFARYVVEDLHQFESLNIRNFESSVVRLGKYRRMLAEWRISQNRYSLSGEDVARILNA